MEKDVSTLLKEALAARNNFDKAKSACQKTDDQLLTAAAAYDISRDKFKAAIANELKPIRLSDLNNLKRSPVADRPLSLKDYPYTEPNVYAEIRRLDFVENSKLMDLPPCSRKPDSIVCRACEARYSFPLQGVARVIYDDPGLAMQLNRRFFEKLTALRTSQCNHPLCLVFANVLLKFDLFGDPLCLGMSWNGINAQTKLCSCRYGEAWTPDKVLLITTKP